MSEVRILRDSCRNWSEFCRMKRNTHKKWFWSCCYQIRKKKILQHWLCRSTQAFNSRVSDSVIAPSLPCRWKMSPAWQLDLSKSCITAVFCNICNVSHASPTSASGSHIGRGHLHSGTQFNAAALQWSLPLWSSQCVCVVAFRLFYLKCGSSSTTNKSSDGFHYHPPAVCLLCSTNYYFSYDVSIECCRESSHRVHSHPCYCSNTGRFSLF